MSSLHSTSPLSTGSVTSKLHPGQQIGVVREAGQGTISICVPVVLGGPGMLQCLVIKG